MSDPTPIYGFPEQWQEFNTRNYKFIAKLENLTNLIDASFNEQPEQQEPIDRALSVMSQLCVEDFLEILLLAGNGYGIAAQKILRGLYERAVTMVYLSKHHEELDTYMNFYYISQQKIRRATLETHGPESMSQKVWEPIERKYEELKENYLITSCEKCKTQRPNHTWSKLDIVTMAKQTGELARLLVVGYLMPMSFAHATVHSMLARLRSDEHGRLSFNPESRPGESDSSLHAGHNIVLIVLEELQKHFGIEGVKLKLNLCKHDFNWIYRGKVSGETPA